MLLPVEVTFRHMPPSESLEAAVREHAAKLDRFHSRITSCRVMVEVLHQRHFKGSVFHVRIDVTVPGAELVASSEPPPQHFHEDVHIAIRDAFDRMRRELQDLARKSRGFIKSHEPHEPLPVGRVTRLVPERGFGFLENADGVEVYFHEHGVIGPGFAALAVGDPVRFEEEPGEKGPQASMVEAVGKE